MITFDRLPPIPDILAWNAGRDAAFLTQWSGGGYAYPLTAGQIEQRLSGGSWIFAILRAGTLIGTIEIMRVVATRGSAHIGRFLLCPSLAGQGLSVHGQFREAPV